MKFSPLILALVLSACAKDEECELIEFYRYNSPCSSSFDSMGPECTCYHNGLEFYGYVEDDPDYIYCFKPEAECECVLIPLYRHSSPCDGGVGVQDPACICDAFDYEYHSHLEGDADWVYCYEPMRGCEF